MTECDPSPLWGGSAERSGGRGGGPTHAVPSWLPHPTGLPPLSSGLIGNKTAQLDRLQFWFMAAGFLAIEPAQFAVGLVNHADRHVEEANQPLALLGLLDADGLTDEGG
jgi:hypothetical protein